MNKWFCLVSFLLTLVGCEQYVAVESPAIVAVEREYILAYVLDTSGSFFPKMFSGDQLAYKFFLKSADLYFRNRMGPHDRILIGQMSGSERTLLWEGSPLALRRRFGSSDALRQFIEEKSDPAGSRAYASLADTLDYIHELPGVKEGKTKVCVLVLSDMLDNSATQVEDRQRLTASLGQFANTSGSIGLFWVDQGVLNDCRRTLSDAGVGQAVVESDIVDDPQLPFTEQ